MRVATITVNFPNEEISRCPVCGSKPVVEYIGWKSYEIYCSRDDKHLLAWGTDVGWAIESWNMEIRCGVDNG